MKQLFTHFNHSERITTMNTRTLLLGLAGWMAAAQLIVPCANASPQTNGAALAKFDEAVAQSRREMRVYCATAQRMMRGEAVTDEHIKEAITHVEQARYKWDRLMRQFKDQPPGPYALDTKFGTRLKDIAQAMREMDCPLRAKKPKESYQACYLACSLIVALHEENNRVHAVDRMFHLRKVLTTAWSAAQIRGPDAVLEHLPEVLHQRNRVMLTPCPWPQNRSQCQTYRRELATLSSLLDELALNLNNGEKSGASAKLNQVMDQLQKAYAAAF
jgi:hypothetical protein